MHNIRPCPNCGVELEVNMNFCPLCGEPIVDESLEKAENIKAGKRKQDKKLLTDYQKLSQSQKRKLFWELSGLILFSGIIITLIIDLLVNNKVSWSRYPITACAAIFTHISLFCFWPKRTLVLILGSFVSTAVLLILLDVFDGDIDWGATLGIPLLLATYLILIGLALAIRNTKEKGLNLVAYSLAACGLLSICVEGIISFNVKGTLQLHWSLVVIACVLPAAGLFFFIHYRLMKGTDLKRFFHI